MAKNEKIIIKEYKERQKPNLKKKKKKPKKTPSQKNRNPVVANVKKERHKKMLSRENLESRTEFAKEVRHKVIETILKDNEITSLEQLQSFLQDYGMPIEREVLSLDLRKMHIVKTITESGVQAYRLPETPVLNPKEYINSANLTSLILSVCEAGNLVVVQTTQAAASAVAVAIEGTGDDHFVGVIAGFDTVFIACETSEKAKIVAQKIRAFGFVSV